MTPMIDAASSRLRKIAAAFDALLGSRVNRENVARGLEKQRARLARLEERLAAGQAVLAGKEKHAETVRVAFERQQAQFDAEIEGLRRGWCDIPEMGTQVRHELRQLHPDLAWLLDL